MKKRFLSFWVIVSLFAINTFAGEVSKPFEDVKQLRIKTVSGDCIMEKSNSKTTIVTVRFTYDEDEYEAEMDQSGSQLRLTERINSGGWGGSSGRSTWTIKVPSDVEIHFNTASGSLGISGINCDLNAETASGNITLENVEGSLKAGTASGDIEASKVKGDIEFGTASGDVSLLSFSGTSDIGTASGRVRADDIDGEIEVGTASGSIRIMSAKGEFKIGAASGDIEVDRVTVEGVSEFSAASGDVEVTLAQPLNHDVEISSASGDAVLDFAGNPIKGHIEMTARADRGDIEAPFEFESEEFHTKGGTEYVTKKASVNGNQPRIEISTASGHAVVKK